MFPAFYLFMNDDNAGERIGSVKRTSRKLDYLADTIVAQ